MTAVVGRRPLRLLTIGAYANGNVGDMAQADAIALLLREIVPDAEIASVALPERQLPYPAARHQWGPATGVFDHGYINRFDRVFVGGGGLLAAKHPPLTDEAWVSRVKAPVFGLAIGAIDTTSRASAHFINACERFSVRDEYSRAAISGVREEADLVLDPVLLTEWRTSRVARGRRKSLLWVPGKIVAATSLAWSNFPLYQFDPDRDTLVSLNPSTDRRSGFGSTFDKVEYVRHPDEFTRMATAHDLVVSERYHGCIMGLAHRCPSIGLVLRSAVVTSKLRALYESLGLEDCLVERLADESEESLRARASNIDWERLDEQVHRARSDMRSYLLSCL